MLTLGSGSPYLAVLCMLVLAGSPAVAQHRIYWGDVHGHTTLSDGKTGPDEFLTYARDVARLDFVIVTDHDFGHEAPWRMPTEAWMLLQGKADAYTVPGKFVAIAGYEWTSQGKYWSGYGKGSERLFEGPPKLYNHKNVYFAARVDSIFSAKDDAYHTPDLLAEATLRAGGLIQNNHPFGDESRDQWEYAARWSSTIVNTEMFADAMHYQGKTYRVNAEQGAREFLGKGGKTGFVSGTDTHDGRPAARTAVLARELTREAIFEALRHRRCYAVSNAKIVLDFTINGRAMGAEIAIEGKPRIHMDVKGTDRIAEAAIIRDGVVLRVLAPDGNRVRLDFVDGSFKEKSYYYLRVTQVDKDEYGNPSYAWSSPIWVKAKP